MTREPSSAADSDELDLESTASGASDDALAGADLDGDGREDEVLEGDDELADEDGLGDEELDGDDLGDELDDDELEDDEDDDALVAAAPARSGKGATSAKGGAKSGSKTSAKAGRGAKASAKTVTPAGSKKHRSSEESAVAAAARAAQQRQRVARDPDANPPWFKPLMFGFLILGFLWIIVYYLSQGRLPIQELGAWNIAVGFGIAFIGFLMTTNWK